jgi:5-formyltetrahydrofolate cyclo-ligase
VAPAMKDELRAQMRAARDAMSVRERAQQSAAISSHVLKWRLWQAANSVLVYRATGSEVATHTYLDMGWKQGKKMGLPRVVDGVFEAIRVRRETPLTPGTFGIMEPQDPTLKPKKSWDLVIVPGLAFDRHGYRVGYGAGHYDRFLAKAKPAATLGLAFEGALVDDVPHVKHDVPVDWVATPAGIRTAEP